MSSATTVSVENASGTMEVNPWLIGVVVLTETLWPAVKLTDTGGHGVRETPDHIDVLGKLGVTLADGWAMVDTK